MAAQIKKKVKALPPDDPAMAPNAVDATAADPAMGEPMAKDMGGDEPYGAQVLRRMHEDHGHLMKDYDQMHRMCENEHVKKLLQKDLQHKASHMDEIEGAFSKHYKDLPPLAGAEEEEEVPEEEKALDEEPAEETEEEEALAEDAGGEVKDMDTPDDAAVGEADDPREEDEPTGEEAFAASTKSLRRKHGGKPMPKRGKGTASDGTQFKPGPAYTLKTDDGKTYSNRDAGAARVLYDELTRSGKRVTVQKGEWGHNKAMEEPDGDEFAPHEKATVGEASGFLKELAMPESEFAEEHRMKSYHYHKSLHGIAQVKDMAEGDPSKPADETADDFDEAQMGKGWFGGGAKPTGGTEHAAGYKAGKKDAEQAKRSGQPLKPMSASSGMEPYDFGYATGWNDGAAGKSLPRKGKGAGADEMTPGMNGETMPPEVVDPVAGKSMRRKSVGEASEFFKSLSGERAFGDPHRKMCEKHFKALDEAMGGGESPPEEEEVQEEFPGATMGEEEPAFEPGEMGEKGRKSLSLDRLAATQRQQIAALTKSVKQLTERLAPRQS